MINSSSLLNSQRIQGYLTCLARKKFQPIQTFKVITSTNSHLLEYSKTHITPSKITVCLAEQQTAGRGRGGRAWFSASQRNIAMSLLWQIPQRKFAANKFLGLSLVIGMVVVKVLRKFTKKKRLLVKWPNDIYWQKKKLGGILIETRLDAKAKIYNVVIGIGINVALSANYRQQIDKKVVDLKQILSTKTPIDRNQLIALILNELRLTLPAFLRYGLQHFYSNWAQYDALYGHKAVHCASDSNGKLTSGIAVGIDERGALLVEIATDNILAFISGSASYADF